MAVFNRDTVARLGIFKGKFYLSLLFSAGLQQLDRVALKLVVVALVGCVVCVHRTLLYSPLTTVRKNGSGSSMGTPVRVPE